MGMFVLKRLAALFLVLLAVSLLSVMIVDLAPGDYLTALRADPQVPQAAVEQMKERFGLDRAWYVRYILWLRQVLTALDFGQSFTYRMPVGRLVGERLLNTLLLTGTALAIAWALGLPLGAAAALRKGSWLDRAATAFAVAGLSVPQMMLALLALYAAASSGLLPAGGMTTAGVHDTMGPAGRAADVLRHLLAPALVLSAVPLATVMRHMRSSLLEELSADYVRAARAKGLSERRVVAVHAARNALNPLISIFGLSLGGLVSSSLVVEWVMGWPGLGALTLEAVRRQDLYVLLGSLVISCAMLGLGNLLGDLLLAANDRRISYE